MGLLAAFRLPGGLVGVVAFLGETGVEAMPGNIFQRTRAGFPIPRGFGSRGRVLAFRAHATAPPALISNQFTLHPANGGRGRFP